ncbi:MAG: CRISPR-associated endonuclease Cas2 [Desulfobacula sp.]|nr:CRISPR-associated endonuclease Cas2 [Desulfobacula sp.]
MAYDISNPKRLSKIHRMIKKHGIAIQKSLFLIKNTENMVNKLLNEISTIMNLKEDDLRAYPIIHPREVWTNSPNLLAAYPAILFSESETERKKSVVKNSTSKKIWKKLSFLFKEK